MKRISKYYTPKITSRLTSEQKKLVRQSTDSRPTLAERFGVTVDQIRYAQIGK